MSRDGVGVLSLSLEFLHLRRWPKDVPIHGSRPTCHVAVNFDTLAALESNFVELPDATVSQRDFAGRAQLWHGLQLRSLHDILHLEVRDERGDAPRDPHTGAAPILASLSVPVTAFLEEAFMQSDAGGAPREFILTGLPTYREARGCALRSFALSFTSSVTSSPPSRVASGWTSPPSRASPRTPRRPKPRFVRRIPSPPPNSNATPPPPPSLTRARSAQENILQLESRSARAGGARRVPSRRRRRARPLRGGIVRVHDRRHQEISHGTVREEEQNRERESRRTPLRLSTLIIERNSREGRASGERPPRRAKKSSVNAEVYTSARASVHTLTHRRIATRFRASKARLSLVFNPRLPPEPPPPPPRLFRFFFTPPSTFGAGLSPPRLPSSSSSSSTGDSVPSPSVSRTARWSESCSRL